MCSYMQYQKFAKSLEHTGRFKKGIGNTKILLVWISVHDIVDILFDVDPETWQDDSDADDILVRKSPIKRPKVAYTGKDITR